MTIEQKFVEWRSNWYKLQQGHKVSSHKNADEGPSCIQRALFYSIYSTTARQTSESSYYINSTGSSFTLGLLLQTIRPYTPAMFGRLTRCASLPRRAVLVVVLWYYCRTWWRSERCSGAKKEARQKACPCARPVKTSAALCEHGAPKSFPGRTFFGIYTNIKAKQKTSSAHWHEVYYTALHLDTGKWGLL